MCEVKVANKPSCSPSSHRRDAYFQSKVINQAKYETFADTDRPGVVQEVDDERSGMGATGR